MELVVHLPGFEKQLNGFQAMWLKKVLACACVPRMNVTHEFGVLLRLSALALLRAIALRRRAASDPRHRQEHDISECARAEPTSWAAAVSTTELDSHLPFAAAELCQSTLSPAQWKAKLHHHIVSVLQPAIRQFESRSWMSSRKNTQYLQGVGASHWTVQQVAALEASVRDCQAWAQLKFQRFFTVQATSFNPRGRRALCGSLEMENVEHPFLGAP
eukprot:s66_g28.t1